MEKAGYPSQAYVLNMRGEKLTYFVNASPRQKMGGNSVHKEISIDVGISISCGASLGHSGHSGGAAIPGGCDTVFSLTKKQLVS